MKSGKKNLNASLLEKYWRELSAKDQPEETECPISFKEVEVMGDFPPLSQEFDNKILLMKNSNLETCLQLFDSMIQAENCVGQWALLVVPSEDAYFVLNF